MENCFDFTLAKHRSAARNPEATTEYSEKVLIVEGQDDTAVIHHLCYRMGIEQNFQIWNAKGQHNLPYILEDMNDAPYIKHIGIVLDADDNFESKLNGLYNLLTEKQLPLPSQPGDKQTHLFILPNHQNNGALEKLVNQSFQTDEPHWQCAETFVNCIAELTTLSDTFKDKLLAKAYLLHKKDRNSITNAAKQENWIDFSQPCFHPLANFLRQFSDIACV